LRRDQTAATLGLFAKLRYDAASGTLLGQLGGAQTARTIHLLLVHPTMPKKDH